MTLHTLSLGRPEPRLQTSDGYDLDGVVVEYDDVANTVDFRLELGRELGIYWAFPVAPNERLRLIYVDSAVSIVEESELVDDPWVADVPSFEARSERAHLTFVSKGGAYQCSIQLDDGGGKLTVLEWPPPITPERKRANDLINAVYANPSDEDLRLVCADALVECGDPRGELIALELKGDKRYATRLRDLAPLITGDAISRRVSFSELGFRRGFLDRLTLRNTSVFWWNEIETAPQLATVRALDIFDSDELARRLVPLLPSTRLQALSELGLSWDHAHYFLTLDEEGRRWLERIEVLSLTEPRGWMTFLRTFPRLAHLRLVWPERASGRAAENLRTLPLLPASINQVTLMIASESWEARRAATGWDLAVTSRRKEQIDWALIRAIVAEVRDDIPLCKVDVP